MPPIPLLSPHHDKNDGFLSLGGVNYNVSNLLSPCPSSDRHHQGGRAEGGPQHRATSSYDSSFLDTTSPAPSSSSRSSFQTPQPARRSNSERILMMEKLTRSGPCALDTSGVPQHCLKKPPPGSETTTSTLTESAPPTSSSSSTSGSSSTMASGTGRGGGKKLPPGSKQKSRSMPAIGIEKPPLSGNPNKMSLEEYQQNRRKKPPPSPSSAPLPRTLIPTDNGSSSLFPLPPRSSSSSSLPPPRGNYIRHPSRPQSRSLSPPFGSSLLEEEEDNDDDRMILEDTNIYSDSSNRNTSRDAVHSRSLSHGNIMMNQPPRMSSSRQQQSRSLSPPFVDDYSSSQRNGSRDVQHSLYPEGEPWIDSSSVVSSVADNHHRNHSDDYYHPPPPDRPHQQSGGVRPGRPPKSRSLPASASAPPSYHNKDNFGFRDDQHREFREIPVYDRHGQPIGHSSSSSGYGNIVGGTSSTSNFRSPPPPRKSSPSPLCGDNPILPQERFCNNNNNGPRSPGRLVSPPTLMSRRSAPSYREELISSSSLSMPVYDEGSRPVRRHSENCSSPVPATNRSRSMSPHVVSPILKTPPSSYEHHRHNSSNRYSGGGGTKIPPQAPFGNSPTQTPLHLEQNSSSLDGRRSPFVSTRTTLSSDAPMIEIEHGVFEPLRGSKETMEAVDAGEISPIECMGCMARFHCMKAARYAICPSCRVISPVPGGIVGVGLGFGLQQQLGVSKTGGIGSSRRRYSGNNSHTGTSHNGRGGSGIISYDSCRSYPPPVVVPGVWDGFNSSYYQEQQKLISEKLLMNAPRRSRLDTA